MHQTASHNVKNFLREHAPRPPCAHSAHVQYYNTKWPDQSKLACSGPVWREVSAVVAATLANLTLSPTPGELQGGWPGVRNACAACANRNTSPCLLILNGLCNLAGVGRRRQAESAQGSELTHGRGRLVLCPAACTSSSHLSFTTVPLVSCPSTQTPPHQQSPLHRSQYPSLSPPFH